MAQRTEAEWRIDVFWEDARIRAGLNPARVYLGTSVTETVQPPAWSFGSTPEEADRILALVLSGAKTATTSPLSDYQPDDPAESDLAADPDADSGESAHQPLPEVGSLSILLDGSGHPRALVQTTAVSVVPFDQVDADHALAEGEGDGTLEQWRQVHREAFGADGRPVDGDLPVVLERFEVLVP